MNTLQLKIELLWRLPRLIVKAFTKIHFGTISLRVCNPTLILGNPRIKLRIGRNIGQMIKSLAGQGGMDRLFMATPSATAIARILQT
jgi:hypothetical protein